MLRLDALPVAYAGEPGAFAEDAVVAAFGDAPRTGLAGFREVFDAVSTRTARAGVVPIENVVNGSVPEVHDLLVAHDLRIVGEVVVPVELCLAAMPGQRLEDIERVYSHSQALGQAERYFRGRPWTLLTTYNTAGAGRLIAERGERGAGAVLSRRAAAGLGLEVIADRVQDVADNRTRFLVLVADQVPADPAAAPRPADPTAAPRPAASRDAASSRTPPDPAYRTTLAFAVRNEPGSLLRALRAFADHGVNLSSLESRPSRSAAWEYVFWADLDARADAEATVAALSELRTETTMVRVLGSYPRTAASP